MRAKNPLPRACRPGAALGLGLVLAGACFLFDPFVSIFDILPDFVGYLLIAAGLYRLGDLLYLLCAFDGAGTCHYGKAAAADKDSSYVYHRVIGVEFPVCAFEGLGYPFDRFNHIKASDKLVI